MSPSITPPRLARPQDPATPTRGRTACGTRPVCFACAAMLVSYLPFSGLNAVLGAVAAATGAGTAGLQWLADAFALALAVVVLPAGGFVQRYGAARITRAGLGLTVLGATVGAAGAERGGAAGLHLLWAAQAVAGLGAGAVMTATLALIAAAAPDAAARARGVSTWAASVVAGLGGGPFLAAAVTGAAGLAAFFPTVAALALLALAVGHGVRSLPSPTQRRLDLPGQATAAIGVAALVTAVIDGGAAGRTTPTTLAAGALALASLSAFALLERRGADPLLPLGLFRSAGFTAAGLAAATVLFSLVGLVFALSLSLTTGHVPALGVAVRLGVLFAANAAGSLLAGRLQSGLSPRAALVAGLSSAAFGAAWLATVLATSPSGTGLAELAAPLAVLGGGSGLAMATCSTLAVNSATGPAAAVAGAANNALRQTGAALAPAVLGAVLTAARHHTAGWAVACATTATATAVLLAAATVLTAVLLFRRGAGAT